MRRYDIETALGLVVFITAVILGYVYYVL